MIAANDSAGPAVLAEMAPDQLRAVIAHAGGLLAFSCGEESAARTLRRVADRLLGPAHTVAEWMAGRQSVSTAARDLVIAGVAAETGLTAEQILTGMKKAPRRARMLAMYRLREVKNDNGVPRYSYPAIGAAFGRDHTTVIHACRKVREAIEAEARGAGE